MQDLNNQVSIFLTWIDLLGYVGSPSKFTSMAWSDYELEAGVIATGMEDGAILLWNASEVMQGRGENMKACIFAAEIHGT